MKKLIYSVTAMTLAFFAASCQQEKLDTVTSGKIVTYTVQVPGAIGTKSLVEEVTAVDKVYYEVYRATEVGDPDKTPVYKGSEDVDDGQASFDLEFVKNQRFVVLFWAQNADLVYTADNTGGMYKIDDLRAVQLITPTVANNAAAQVFAGSDTVTDCASAARGNVILTRPVSQINVFTTQASLDFGTPGIELQESSMTVDGLYSTYNVAEGKAVVTPITAEFEYKSARVPATPENAEYVTVAMNYVGFAAQNGSTVNVDFSIKTSEANLITHKVANVPVKPNYRTNITGNLITATSSYDVELNDSWSAEDNEPIEVVYVTVSSASDLQTAIDEAPEDGTQTNIKLEDNIDLSQIAGMISTRAEAPVSGLEIPADKSVILDLNGRIISQNVQQTSAYSMIVNKGTLTILDSKGNGSIAYKDTGKGGEYASNTLRNDGILTIEGGTIVNNSSPDVASAGYPHPVDNNGVLTINGGTLSNNANYASMRIWCTTDDNTIVTINGGTFNGSIDFQTPNNAANKGTLTINGGTFNADTYTNCAVRLLGFGADVDEMNAYISGGIFNGQIALRNWSGADLNSQVFHITGGTYTSDPSAFVTDDYAVVYDETEKVYNIVPAVAEVGDIRYGSLEAAFAAAEDKATIVVLCDTEMEAVTIPEDKTLTLDLNGKTVTGVDNTSKNYGLISLSKSADLTVKNGMMKLSATINSGWGRYSAVLANNQGTLTVQNCTIEHLGGTDMAYAIDNLTNSGIGDAILKVKDESLIRSSYIGIRQFLNCGTKVNSLVVDNATVQGGRLGIWMQEPHDNPGQGKLEVKETAEVSSVRLSAKSSYTTLPVDMSVAATAVPSGIVEATDLPVGYTLETIEGVWKLVHWTKVGTAEDLITTLTDKSDSYRIMLIDDITISDNWDARYTGAKITVPVVIDGLDHTIKFTNTIIDNNHYSVFRFEDSAEVKNLKFDLSESQNTSWLRAISAKASLIVDNCEFIGKVNVNSRGIIFGEGAQTSDASVSITNSVFTGWRRGVTDNENAKDIKEVVLEGNIFDNADVAVSAYDNIVFNGNKMTESDVSITSYTASATAKVIALNNILNTEGTNVIGSESVKFNAANVSAQEGFEVFAE